MTKTVTVQFLRDRFGNPLEKPRTVKFRARERVKHSKQETVRRMQELGMPYQMIQRATRYMTK